MCAKHVRPLVCVSFHFVANPFPVTLCWSSLCLGIDLECSATRRSPRPNAAQPVRPTRKDFEAMDAIGDDLFVPSPNAVPARFLRPEPAPAANVAHAIRAFVGLRVTTLLTRASVGPIRFRPALLFSRSNSHQVDHVSIWSYASFIIGCHGKLR